MIGTRVAAVLTVFNRRELTLACLRSLALQARDGLQIDVFVTDDGSTDGTGEAIRAEFPEVTILEGDGSLFWGGGMHAAFGEALRHDYDHYLWLNDDTQLDDGAVEVLVATYSQLGDRGHGPVIVIGATRDPDTGDLTYGGVVRRSRWRPMRFDLLPPADQPQPCETMNGNCVLVPAPVARRVGNVDSSYVQKMGDYDYGLRARAKGFEVWIAPGTLGTCARNIEPAVGTRPLRVELRSLASIKELPPGPWRTFVRRWGGPLWPVYWASPYLQRSARIARGRLVR